MDELYEVFVYDYLAFFLRIVAAGVAHERRAALVDAVLAGRHRGNKDGNAGDGLGVRGIVIDHPQAEFGYERFVEHEFEIEKIERREERQ